MPFYVMGAREEWIEGGPGGLGLSRGFWGDGNWGRERRGGGEVEDLGALHGVGRVG